MSKKDILVIQDDWNDKIGKDAHTLGINSYTILQLCNK